MHQNGAPELPCGKVGPWFAGSSAGGFGLLLLLLVLVSPTSLEWSPRSRPGQRTHRIGSRDKTLNAAQYTTCFTLEPTLVHWSNVLGMFLQLVAVYLQVLLDLSLCLVAVW